MKSSKLSANQRIVLSAAIGTPLNPAHIRNIPHGVFRSLIMRGLLRWQSGYRITPEGKNLLHHVMSLHYRNKMKS